MFDLCTTGDTSITSSCQKNNFFSFHVAVKNSIKVGPLIFLLQMFVITENIMKRPVLQHSKNSFQLPVYRIIHTNIFFVVVKLTIETETQITLNF
jgi:hypothetical protein